MLLSPLVIQDPESRIQNQPIAKPVVRLEVFNVG